MTDKIPDIARDKLAAFRRMAVAVIDDMHEAAGDLANRHEHQVDLLKTRVAELEAQIERATADLCRFTGADTHDLAAAVEVAAMKLQALPAPQFFDGPAKAPLPMENGPFVVTIKTPHGLRWLVDDGGDPVWGPSLDAAVRYLTRGAADSIRPRRSSVVTLADALELIEAEQVKP